MGTGNLTIAGTQPGNAVKIQTICYRSGMVDSKSFVGKLFLRIKWKFELNSTL